MIIKNSVYPDFGTHKMSAMFEDLTLVKVNIQQGLTSQKTGVF